jgi:hypothetical protein
MKNLSILLIAALTTLHALSQTDTLKVFKVSGIVYFESATDKTLNTPEKTRLSGLISYDESKLSDTLLVKKFLLGTEFEGLEIKKLYVNIGVNPKLTWDQKEFVLYPQQLMDGTRQNFKRNFEKWSNGRYAIDDTHGIRLYMNEQRIKTHRAKAGGYICFPLAPFFGIAALVREHHEHQALRGLTFLENN